MTGFPVAHLSVPPDWDRRGLPGWTYRSPALFALERERLFLTHWQVAGHESDVPEPGDWLGFDMLGERAVVMRGQDGRLRAFHNLCRHRGARVVDGARGHCKGAIVCPFHGWVYNTDGTLRGPAQPATFGAIDRAEFGLKPVELEVWHGFLFLRFAPGPQPAVADWLAPFARDVAAYRSAALVPAPETDWQAELPVNWKSVRDVDNEGYHVPMAHPGLQELYGRTYRDLCLEDGLSVSHGTFGPAPGQSWSVRRYVALSPETDLPPHLARTWTYYGLFPNAVFAFTPESAQFYQEIPVAPGVTRLQGRAYRAPGETRAARVARYLARRIDRDTSAEDRQLSVWSDESTRSAAFDGFHLSDLEYGLRRHHDGLRALIPVIGQAAAPPEAEMSRINDELICPPNQPV